MKVLTSVEEPKRVFSDLPVDPCSITNTIYVPLSKATTITATAIPAATAPTYKTTTTPKIATTRGTTHTQTTTPNGRRWREA